MFYKIDLDKKILKSSFLCIFGICSFIVYSIKKFFSGLVIQGKNILAKLIYLDFSMIIISSIINPNVFIYDTTEYLIKRALTKEQ